MRYEVDVTINKPLDDRNRQFLDAVQRSANRVVRFTGDERQIRLTVDVAGMCREEAVRAAAGEVTRIFPNSTDEKYGEPRPAFPTINDLDLRWDSGRCRKSLTRVQTD